MQSFLWKIYLARFLDAFILIGVLFTLFFSQSNLSPFEISLLIAIWSITTILTEVPFGVLADTYSRRNLLILGLILRAIGFGFWMMGGFVNFAIGFILWGLKNTLTSGTLEALVYDELAYFKKEEHYEEVSGKMSAAFSLGLLLSAICGGILAQISFSFVLIASIVTTLLSAVIIASIRSVKAVQSTGEVNYYQTLRKAILQIKNNTTVVYIIAFICVIFAAFGAVDEYWALIYEKLGLDATAIGILVALVYGLGTIAGYTVKYFDTSSKYLGFMLIILGACSYLILGVTASVVLLPVAFLGIYLFQIASIKLDAQLQHNISAEQRATISSIKSLLFEVVYMGFMLLFGFIGSTLGVISILSVAGVFLLVLIGFFSFSKPRGISIS